MNTTMMSTQSFCTWANMHRGHVWQCAPWAWGGTVRCSCIAM